MKLATLLQSSSLFFSVSSSLFFSLSNSIYLTKLENPRTSAKATKDLSIDKWINFRLTRIPRRNRFQNYKSLPSQIQKYPRKLNNPKLKTKIPLGFYV